MAAQGLNNRETADVVTYARMAWGNDASEVTESQVEIYKDEASTQEGQWTGDQLKDIYKDSFKGD